MLFGVTCHAAPEGPSEMGATDTFDHEQEHWSAVKLPPRLTGLPMAVWINQNDGYQHDVRVKVSLIRGGGGSWRTGPSIAVRPQPHEVRPGSLPAADVARHPLD